MTFVESWRFSACAEAHRKFRQGHLLNLNALLLRQEKVSASTLLPHNTAITSRRSTNTMDLHDPFQLNLRQQSAALLEYLHIPSSSSSVPPTASPYAFLPLSHLVPLLPDSNVSPEEFVDVLSDLLEVQPLTAKIAELFRPLLMVLMARWADRVRGGREEWVRRVVAGSLLAEGLEEVWP
jgi:hypothetical protein